MFQRPARDVEAMFAKIRGTGSPAAGDMTEIHYRELHALAMAADAASRWPVLACAPEIARIAAAVPPASFPERAAAAGAGAGATVQAARRAPFFPSAGRSGPIVEAALPRPRGIAVSEAFGRGAPRAPTARPTTGTPFAAAFRGRR